jgi:O-antigen ligase
MNDRIARLATLIIALGLCIAGGCIAIFRPDLLSGEQYLKGLIFLQVVFACLWAFRRRFFPLLIAVFLAAGTAVPVQDACSELRWVVLAIGAIAGYVVYMKDCHHHFGALHLAAGLAVLSALVSALASSYPHVSLLKVFSLLLLFLYAVSGARLAIFLREARFFPALLTAVEILVYVSAACYFVFRYPLYGNPNSLGAVAGVVFTPLLLWNVLTTRESFLRQRRWCALGLCLLLLFFSQARAGVLAAFVTCTLLCVTLRKARLLVMGIALSLLLAVAAIYLTPADSEQDAMPVRHEGASIPSYFLYKGKVASGVLGSRASPWEETSAVIREHPWFGSGFGTSAVWDVSGVSVGRFSSTSMTTREHGNSYLAITEWVGILGLIPFALLLGILGWNLARVFRWLAATRDPAHYCVPVTLVLTAGLVHATFEDWLFAVGYYLCVFFWVFAFSLPDLLPPALASARQLRPVWTDQAFSQTLPAGAASR